MTSRVYLYGWRTDRPIAAEEWNSSWGQACDVAVSVARHHLTKVGYFHGSLSVRCLPDRTRTELLPLSMGGGFGHRIAVEVTETRMEVQ